MGLVFGPSNPLVPFSNQQFRHASSFSSLHHLHTVDFPSFHPKNLSALLSLSLAASSSSSFPQSIDRTEIPPFAFAITPSGVRLSHMEKIEKIFKDLVLGFGTGLAVEGTSSLFRQFYNWLQSKGKPTEYEEKLKLATLLGGAIIEELPEGQEIKNEHVKTWISNLIEATGEAARALQSSTADAEALKSACTKLEGLTKDAKTYLALLGSQKQKEAIKSFISAACGVDYEFDLIEVDDEGIKWYGAPNSAPVAAAGGNLDTLIVPGSRWFVVRPIPVELPFSVVAGNLETPMFNPYYDHLNKKRMFPECSPTFAMFEKIEATAYKRQRGLGDGLKEEFEKNSVRPYGSEKAFIYNDEQCINDRMKMKGKCLEGEFDESCSPSGSYGGASDHVATTSFGGTPEENDASVGDVL